MSGLSTAKNPSPFDPLDRMPPDEGRFVIRETDHAGPAAMTEWCRVRRNALIRQFGTNPQGDAKRLFDAEMAQIRQAEDLALEWSERIAGGAATDEAGRVPYADVVLSEEQVAAARIQRMRADLVQHLREADYAAHELLEMEGPAASADFALQAAAIHELATTIIVPARSEAA